MLIRLSVEKSLVAKRLGDVKSWWRKDLVLKDLSGEKSGGEKTSGVTGSGAVSVTQLNSVVEAASEGCVNIAKTLR